MIGSAITLAPLLMAALVSSTPVQFDLVCTGTTRAHAESAPAAWSESFAIDFARSAWCRVDRCLIARPIFRIDPGEIELSEGGLSVFRSTGEVLGSELDAEANPVRVDGKCVLAPFTGFPLNLF